jgi:hypothetical protein
VGVGVVLCCVLRGGLKVVWYRRELVERLLSDDVWEPCWLLVGAGAPLFDQVDRARASGNNPNPGLAPTSSMNIDSVSRDSKGASWNFDFDQCQLMVSQDNLSLLIISNFRP